MQMKNGGGGGVGKKLVSVTFLPHTCFTPAD
jgi:hypothetical protein